MTRYSTVRKRRYRPTEAEPMVKAGRLAVVLFRDSNVGSDSWRVVAVIAFHKRIRVA